MGSGLVDVNLKSTDTQQAKTADGKLKGMKSTNITPIEVKSNISSRSREKPRIGVASLSQASQSSELRVKNSNPDIFKRLKKPDSQIDKSNSPLKPVNQQEKKDQ